MNIIESIAPFDVETRKGFDFHQIVNALATVDEVEKMKPEFVYEKIAMELVPTQTENPWGFYYGPQFTFANEQGELMYVPSLNDITSDTIMYWEDRAKACNNPLLIARYADLVWDFKQKIAHRGQEPWMYRLCVDNMLRVCDEDYCSHPVITVNVLERLFAISKDTPEDNQLVKDTFVTFEQRHSKDDTVRLWASRFLLMMEHKKSFTDIEVNILIKEHEERLVRLSTPNDNGRVNPWIVMEQAKLLAKYYNSIQNRDDIKRVLNITERTFEHEYSNMSAIQLMGNLETVCQMYSHYGLKDEWKQLSVKIQELGARVKEEMQPFQTEFEISQEVYDLADEYFGDKAESSDVRWRNFASYFILTKAQEEVELRELVKKYPFQFMIGNSLMDSKGHPMSYVGPYEDDPEGQLILHMAKKINIQSYFLSIAINRLLTTNTLTVDNVMSSLIIPSPLFEESRYDIIREVIELFIQGKYILFSHLIIPQIEYAICNLIEMSGVPILKPQRGNKGYQLRTLGDLLREQCVEDTFTSDGALYLQIVLTNQKALNIRNLLCHGIMPPEYFGFGAAGRLLHILVMLGLTQTIPPTT